MLKARTWFGILAFILSTGCFELILPQPHAPNPDEFYMLEISTPSGWSLCIVPEGSGSICFKAQGALAQFPPGTFAFEAVKKELSSSLLEDGNMSDDYYFAFFRRGESETHARYSDDDAYVSQLFLWAKLCSGQSKDLGDLWKTTPPTPRTPVRMIKGDAPLFSSAG